MPASLAVSCSSMQCRNSNLMLGNVTMQQTSGGCNVTTCSYGGFVNGTIITVYVMLCLNKEIRFHFLYLRVFLLWLIELFRLSFLCRLQIVHISSATMPG